MLAHAPCCPVFDVLTLPGPFDRISQPRSWTLSEYVRLTLMLVHVVLAMVLPPVFTLLAFIFWRLMYNGFLGVLLRNQSRHRSFSRWYKRQREADSLVARLLCKMVDGSIGPANAAKLPSLPADYQAWLAFREVAEAILNLDTGCFVLVVIRYFEAPTLTSLITYPLAIALCLLSMYAKLDALRVLGDFAWFWGDCWFLLLSQDLTFDGVYMCAPHPMYTIAYVHLYALAWLASSFTVLHASLFAHFCQLLFRS